MDDHFGVGVGAKDVAALLELGAQLLEVVDFAVEDDPDRLVGIGHRLMAAGEIDDRQPPEAEADRTLHEVALVIRAAMGDRISHQPDLSPGRRARDARS